MTIFRDEGFWVPGKRADAGELISEPRGLRRRRSGIEMPHVLPQREPTFEELFRDSKRLMQQAPGPAAVGNPWRSHVRSTRGFWEVAHVVRRIALALVAITAAISVAVATGTWPWGHRDRVGTERPVDEPAPETSPTTHTLRELFDVPSTSPAPAPRNAADVTPGDRTSMVTIEAAPAGLGLGITR